MLMSNRTYKRALKGMTDDVPLTSPQVTDLIKPVAVGDELSDRGKA